MTAATGRDGAHEAHETHDPQHAPATHGDDGTRALRDQRCRDALRLPRRADTLAALFDARVDQAGDAPFLLFRERSLSWRQAQAQARAWGERLTAAGCRRGDRVAVALPNCDTLILLLLACAQRGLVFGACNPSADARTLAAMLTVLQPAAVVAPRGHAALDGGITMPALVVDPLSLLPEDGVHAGPAPAAGDGSPGAVTDAATDTFPAAPAPDDPLAIVFTSGTTGVPKGALHSQRTYVTAAEIATWRMRLSPADRMLVVLPLFHLNALFYSVGGAIASGARLVVAERFQASTFWRTVAHHGITQVNLIAAVGNILLKRDRAEFCGNHTLTKVSAAPVSADVAQRLADAFGIRHVVESYGMSEAPGIAQVDFDDDTHRACLGRPIRHPLTGEPVSEVRIVDEQRRPLPPGQVGRVMVRSTTMMRGYFNRPDLADAVDAEGWFLTADLAQADADGYLYFRGRTAEMIRHRGENIAASDIEATLLSHPAISDAGCIGVPSDLGEEDILAAVVLRPDARLTPAAFADWCARALPALKRPRWLAVLPDLPKTATEKVARHRLRDDPRVRAGAVDLQAAPATAGGTADTLPLAGITVVDLSTRLPGPLATLMLAQAGARVIRVEPLPHGEETRQLAPRIDGVSAHYQWLNQGKTTRLLDLKSAEGRTALHALLAEADVLVEQFRPGVMQRLGFGPDELLARHPRLVYCAITGYGRDDPRSLKAAHDLNYQADAGLVGAAPPGARGVPVLPTVLLGDLAGGTQPAVTNILLALLRRQQTGRGGFVDVAMSRNIEMFNGWNTLTGLLTGQWPVPGRGRHTGGSPRYNLYRAQDGRLLAVAALEDRFWRQFLDGIGLDLPAELETADPDAAIERLATHLAGQPSGFWLERLAGRDACCNLVAEPHEAAARHAGAPAQAALPSIPLPLSPALTKLP